MRFFKDLGIGRKIVAVVLFATVVAVINAVVGANSLNAVNNRLNGVVDVGAAKIKLAARINRNMVEVGRAEKNIILSTTQQDMDTFVSYTESYRADIKERLATLRELADAEGQQLTDEFEAVWEEYLKLNREVRDLTRENSGRRAFLLAFGEGRGKLGTAEAQLTALVDKIDADLEDARVLQAANRQERGLAYQKVVLIARIKQNLLSISRAEKNLILAITPEEQQQVFDVLDREWEELSTRRVQLRELVDAERQDLLDEFAVTFEEWRDVSEEVRKLAVANEIEKATELARDVGRPIFDEAEAKLGDLVAKIDADLEAVEVLQGANSQAFDEANEKVVLIAHIKQNLLAISRAEKNLILAKNPEIQNVALAVFEAEWEQLNERRTRLRTLVDEESQGLLDEFAATIDEWRIVSQQVRDLAVADTNDKAIAIAQGDGRAVFDKAAALMTQIVDKNEADLDAERQASDAIFRRTLANMLVISVGSIVLGLLLGVLVSRYISTGLNRLVIATQHVAAGDFTQPIQVDAGDEVGILATAFNQMTVDLRRTTVQLKGEIAERKQAEETLQESEQWLSTTLRSIGDAVIATDAKGLVTLINPVTKDLTGWDEAEAVGQPLEDVFNIINEQTGERAENPVTRVLREGVVVGLANHTVLIAKDGTKRPIADSGAPMRDEEGNIIGTVMVFRDITERKEMQERLVRREKLAVLGQLAGGVGHELRNPLGVISNAAYFLQMVLADADETTREYLGIIGSQVRNAEKIVSDLLDLSRTRSAEREEVALSELVAEVMEGRQPPEGVEVTTRIASDLPTVFVDRLQMRQVLANLVANAYQAMPDGGKLDLSARAEEGRVCLSVADTGCGIPPENVGKIFEPLFTTRARGIGLGLAVSRNLVQVNGGTIEVQSPSTELCEASRSASGVDRTGEEGQGSTFTVALPAREVGS